MAFPRPLPIPVEMHAGPTLGWVDISSDVKYENGLTIRRARQSESSEAAVAGSCSLTIRKDAAIRNARHPESVYYNKIGLNTPLRVGVRRVVDDFSRTVNDSWGTTSDDTQVWSQFGDSSAASDWNVTPGVATHSIDAANESRISYLADTDFSDIDVAVSVDITGVTNVTGASLFPGNILLRGTSTSSWIRVRVQITDVESVRVEFVNAAGSIIGTHATVLSGWAGEQLRVRGQIEGRTCRARVWAPSLTAEPATWHLVVSDPTLTDLDTPSGWVAVRSSVATGNTNTKPVVFEYSDWVVTIPRYAGELPDWTQRAGKHPNDVDLTVQASGILRRLGRRSAPKLSAMRRAILAADAVPPIAYWTLEDETDTTVAASALPAGRPLVPGGGEADTITWSSNDDFDGSLELPKFGGPLGAFLQGDVVQAPEDDQLLAFGLLSVPAAGVSATVAVLDVKLRGGFKPLGLVRIEVNTSGEARLRVRDWLGVDVLESSFSTGFALNGAPSLIGLRLTQDGADVDWQIFRYLAGSQTPTTHSGTITGKTFGWASGVIVGLGGSLNEAAMGHVAVYQNDADTALSTAILSAVTGWTSEAAGDRAERLAAEESIPFAYYGTLSDTTLMGAQGAEEFRKLVNECAAADLGILHEPRGDVGLLYRTRTSLYHQTATTLDYATNEITPPLRVVDDDQLVVNDVTGTRPGGSSRRAVLETGRRSIQDPPDGVGVYDEGPTVNVATDPLLEDHVSWRLALGTIDGVRCPAVTVELHRLDTRIDELAAVDVGSRIEITNPPTWLPPEPLDLLVVGVQEYLDQFNWKITWVCVPAELYAVPVLDSTPARKVDTDDSTLAAGVNTTATSLSVASTWLWTTSAGQMPIAIMIGGEEMSVTAISGASSPQTFTVTRSVNGIVKSHDADDPVALAPRSRFGY